MEEEVLESIKKQNNQFSISNEVVSVINQGVKGFANSIARAVVLGEQLNASFKELAQSLLITIIQKTIERIALMGIGKILAETLFKKFNLDLISIIIRSAIFIFMLSVVEGRSADSILKSRPSLASTMS